jgi:transcriptional regulator with XRE-family HTH domain
MSTLGTRIRDRRVELGLTVAELALKVRVRRDILEAVERNGDSSRALLSGRDVLQLSKALGSSIDWLLTGETPPAPPADEPVMIFVCSRGQGRHSHRCKECGARASKQCAYALAAKAARKTCDVWLCERCAVVVGTDRDYCPPHARHAAKQLTLHERKET